MKHGATILMALVEPDENPSSEVRRLKAAVNWLDADGFWRALDVKTTGDWLGLRFRQRHSSDAETPESRSNFDFRQHIKILDLCLRPLSYSISPAPHSQKARFPRRGSAAELAREISGRIETTSQRSLALLKMHFLWRTGGK
jgi:hypothetical protein